MRLGRADPMLRFLMCKTNSKKEKTASRFCGDAAQHAISCAAARKRPHRARPAIRCGPPSVCGL
eukprot:6209540-Pleurochrysis_carterae.AAC.1